SFITRDNLGFDDVPQVNSSESLSSGNSYPPRERLVGRISAWLCATLYLTSRLPQIWKNVRHCSSDVLKQIIIRLDQFVRRSVEVRILCYVYHMTLRESGRQGLSMYLFTFAFLGNSFYVASILTSPPLRAPPPEATAFIKESLPYVALL